MTYGARSENKLLEKSSSAPAVTDPMSDTAKRKLRLPVAVILPVEDERLSGRLCVLGLDEIIADRTSAGCAQRQLNNGWPVPRRARLKNI